jgi:gas vesicle protein
MNERDERNGDCRLLAGLAIGGIVGAALAMWLAPRANSAIKSRAADSARSLGRAASESYRDARVRVTETVDEIARKGQGLRNDALDKVARVAQGVEASARSVQHFAVDAKTKVS